jgi:hypothetical protein
LRELERRMTEAQKTCVTKSVWNSTNAQSISRRTIKIRFTVCTNRSRNAYFPERFLLCGGLKKRS